MSKLDDLKDEAIQMLDDDDDLFVEIIDELDNQNGFADGWRGYPMHYLDELYGDMPLRDFLQKLTSDFDINDDYFIDTIYGLESTGDLADHYRGNTSSEEVLDRVLVTPRLYIADGDFKALIDDINVADEEDDMDESIKPVVNKIIEGADIRKTLAKA